VDLESIAIKLSRSENLPALSNAVVGVLNLVNDDQASAKAIETIMEKDCGLSAKLLRAANSTYYGGYQCHSIDRAVTVLGLNALKSLILALSFQSISCQTSKSKGFDKIAFWQHSFATATAARILGKLLAPGKAEELYSAAMMHDIGYLVLERFLPIEFGYSIELARVKNVKQNEAEKQIFGFDHSEAGGLLAEKWGLPPQIHDAIRYHHCKEQLTQLNDITHFVSAANTIAHQCGFSTTPLPEGYSAEFDPLTLSTVNLPEEQLVVVRNVVAQEVAKAREALMIKAA
jgi:HD-like signal output (HDOD) protein